MRSAARIAIKADDERTNATRGAASSLPQQASTPSMAESRSCDTALPNQHHPLQPPSSSKIKVLADGIANNLLQTPQTPTTTPATSPAHEKPPMPSQLFNVTRENMLKDSEGDGVIIEDESTMPAIKYEVVNVFGNTTSVFGHTQNQVAACCQSANTRESSRSEESSTIWNSSREEEVDGFEEVDEFGDDFMSTQLDAWERSKEQGQLSSTHLPSTDVHLHPQ